MNNHSVKRIFLTIVVTITLVAMGSCCKKKEADGAPPHWTYEGEEGPAHWGDLSEKYSACKLGKNQSPVDIKAPFESRTSDLKIDYKSSPATIVNNGHTIQVTPNDGGSIEIDGVKYKLAQFHFHSPSEHNVDGKSFPLEVHFVHKNEKGDLAVIGVLFEEGAENPIIGNLWGSIPGEVKKEMALAEAINPSDLLPADRNFYAYSGSLTTPPCSEGVKWHVMVSPLSVSSAQVSSYAAIHPHSNRPVQPVNDRKLLK